MLAFIMVRSNTTRRYLVPDLKGKTVVQAEEILTKLKLTYSWQKNIMPRLNQVSVPTKSGGQEQSLKKP